MTFGEPEAVGESALLKTSEAVDPAVTIVVPSFNLDAYVAGAVGSALAQTRGDIEVLAIDDVSRDGSIDRLLAIDDPRLAVRLNARNLGLTGNVNLGLAYARGHYLTVLGADDVLSPDFVERAAAILDAEPSVSLVHGAATWIDGDGRAYGRSDGDWPQRSSGPDAFVRCLKSGFCFSTMMFRREALRGCGLAPLEWNPINDTWLFLRMALAGGVAHVPEPLCGYRVHRGGMSLGMYADGSLFRRHLWAVREAFAWPEARTAGLADREGEAARGVVRNALEIAHLARIALPAREFGRLIGELFRASPGAFTHPRALARLGLTALPPGVLRALRERRRDATGERGAWSPHAVPTWSPHAVPMTVGSPAGTE